MIAVKILSLGDPERYAVRRIVVVAQQELQSHSPDLQVTISEVEDAGEIGKHASVLVLPTLIINEKMVCCGRFPTREEVVGWLEKAIKE